MIRWQFLHSTTLIPDYKRLYILGICRSCSLYWRDNRPPAAQLQGSGRHSWKLQLRSVATTPAGDILQLEFFTYHMAKSGRSLLLLRRHAYHLSRKHIRHDLKPNHIYEFFILELDATPSIPLLVRSLHDLLMCDAPTSP
jgi:hypothetical protein